MTRRFPRRDQIPFSQRKEIPWKQPFCGSDLWPYQQMPANAEGKAMGHGESMLTAVSIARAGGFVGRVGVPQEQVAEGYRAMNERTVIKALIRPAY